MKWRSLRAFLAADFPASTKPAARDHSSLAPFANASSMLPAASQLIFAHEMALPSCLPGSRFSCKQKPAAREPQFTRAIRKTHLRCFPLLRSSFLLMKWRSLRAFLAADFPASTKPAAGSHSSLAPFANASSMLPCCFAAHFAHEMALPSCPPQQIFRKHETCCEGATFTRAIRKRIFDASAASQLIFAHEMAPFVPSWQQIFLQARNLLPGRLVNCTTYS